MSKLQITFIEENLYHVINEPGDHTRYDYFVYQSGNIFRFMSKNNSFAYPNEIDIHVSLENTLKYKRDIVNPWTIKQCYNVSQKIYKNEYNNR